MKDEVLGIFKEFFHSGKFVKILNNTFNITVRKRVEAEDFKDYRLISLVGSLYKLITKILANRIRNVMSKLVSKAKMPLLREGKFWMLPLLQIK